MKRSHFALAMALSLLATASAHSGIANADDQIAGSSAKVRPSTAPSRSFQDRATALIRPSTTEDVGLTFYKVAGAKPDFAYLIRQSDAYKKLKPTDQQKIMEEEVSRLQTHYNSIDPKKSVLTIRTAVELNVITDPKTQKYELDVTYPSKGIVYFPYNYGGRAIAVVADGLEVFEKIAVTDREATKATGRIEGRKRVTMVLELTPITANAREPMVLDGSKQFILLGKIGYIGFLGRNLEEIWSWQAEGHTMTGQDSLLNLRQGQ